MKLITQNFTKGQSKIYALFYTFPEKTFIASQIAQHTGLALSGVLKIMPTMSYITLKHEYSMTFYTLSDQFPVHEKRLYNMYCLYASGLLTYLGREYAGCTIYIFGSYSKGEDISSSDIDICVIGSTQEIPVDKYEKKLYRRISFHLFMHQQDIHAHLLSSIIGGFCVQGGFVF